MTPAQQQAELYRQAEAIAYRRVVGAGERPRRPLLDLLDLPDPGASTSTAETGRQRLRATLRTVDPRIGDPWYGQW